MLTFVESISLAGDRKKQNDDAFGFAGGRAWVIDGATDLHDTPLTQTATDASWIAHTANARLYGAGAGSLRDTLRATSASTAEAFAQATRTKEFEKWQSPIASLLMLEVTSTGVSGIDLGDCRVFALDADGAVHVAGGPEGARDAEAEAAAQQTDADKPLLQRANTIDMLRRSRASMNRPGAQWTFGLDPACADHARTWTFNLKRPAHILLMTDGFSVLTDQYERYTPTDLVRAVLKDGVQTLTQEIRAIENADALGAAHPRFKKSDDSTALLMRLT